MRRLLLAACLAALLGGCSNLGYYLQAVGGQMDMLGRARPIQAVLDDPSTSERLKQQLVDVGRIRQFASAELGLPDNGSFRRYADLQRPFAVWNVFAAAEFSTKPKRWCYLLVGCADYRGYFSAAAAAGEAEQLRRQGYDVYVAGIPAYSTLGWFDDPVLNTVIDYPVIRLAPLIFHELAHQVAYARDDTTFNESFAVAVELEGMRRWLERFGTPEQKAAFALERRRRD
ncbi:MAG TPA: aminopeptidase, partial [Rhodocyclaceae bacterium]|nr:aminopeptidase [Rhodocyclaceae bacterium]